jgi:hypothetical protein
MTKLILDPKISDWDNRDPKDNTTLQQFIITDEQSN